MKGRYYVDARTELPHIYRQDVSELEAQQVLERPAEDRPGIEGCRVAVGPTSTDRTLRVIWVSGPAPDSGFVITADDLSGKPLLAHRRRRCRKVE
jgi:hypothetical protein